MFDFLEGDLARRAPNEAVVACGGVGYLAAISLESFKALPEHGRVRLLIHVHTSDAGVRLFGFVEERERLLFRKLISVSGVGPALALTLLSNLPPAELAIRIVEGDVKTLTRIKGIGTKTAERLILELKDKLTVEPGIAATSAPEQLLEQALESLGLDGSEAAALARATVKGSVGETRLELLLRTALRTHRGKK